MKGALLSINPRAAVVDITHEIAAHDIEAGAFTLLAAREAFPAGTVHVAVVDPGVGSERRALGAEAGGQFFVGPDNGLFSYVFERAGRSPRVFHLTNREYFRESVSTTFHGRDVFAPVAAHLSAGARLEDIGPPVEDWARLAPLTPRAAPDGALEASVIHIDRFGNCVTSLTRRELTEEMIARGAALSVNGRTVRAFRRFFADEAAGANPLFAVWGSAGFLDLAAFRASAAELLGARRGQIVRVTSDG
jgi:hypothetical protein